jgi:hypothetical protein
MGTGVVSLVQSGGGVELTSHIHPMLMLKKWNYLSIPP